MKYLANSILNRKLSASPRPVLNGASPSRTTTYNSSCSKSCQVVDPWSAYDYAINGLDLSAHALSYDISSMCYRKMKQQIMRAIPNQRQAPVAKKGILALRPRKLKEVVNLRFCCFKRSQQTELILIQRIRSWYSRRMAQLKSGRSMKETHRYIRWK